MVKIAPSLFAADFTALKKEVEEISSAEYIHLDVMDGHFVPNLSFGPHVVKAIRPLTDQVFDVHLMISNPLTHIPNFAKAGADIITVHVEADDDIGESLKLIKSFGIKCGIVLSPETPVEAAEPYLDTVDMILIMSVHPGFGGQKFMEEVLTKISYLKKVRGERRYEIEIDGGINEQTAKLAVEAGTDVLVAGTTVFKAPGKNKMIAALRSCV